MDQRTILIAVAVAVVLGIIWYSTQTPDDFNGPASGGHHSHDPPAP